MERSSTSKLEGPSAHQHVHPFSTELTLLAPVRYEPLTAPCNLALLEKTVICAAIQDDPNILRHPKFHYTVHELPLLVPIMIQINQFTESHSIFPKSILTLSSPLRLDLPCCLFPSRFHTTFSAHIILLDLSFLLASFERQKG
jgi:hypothetical protein